MQKVVGSNPISRLPDRAGVPQVKPGALAEWLRSGLQSRLHRFDSGRRLSSVHHTLDRLWTSAALWPSVALSEGWEAPISTVQGEGS